MRTIEPIKIGIDLTNEETQEALEEVQKMKLDPSIGKTYTDVDAMMDDLLRRSSESSMNKSRKIYGV